MSHHRVFAFGRFICICGFSSLHRVKPPAQKLPMRSKSPIVFKRGDTLFGLASKIFANNGPTYIAVPAHR